jgi:sucrose-phosphate synthase
MNIEKTDGQSSENPAAPRGDGLHIALLSLHGLIRATDCELGRDADTGGQTKYVLELAAELAKQPEIARVELITRQVVDPKIHDDYAQLEEPIPGVGNAKIVRIPFGPKRYLKKEALWPYMEVFIDQTISHFKRTGLPDLIHGHYADAGLGGGQLARLLHIPFVFTGHSLGRVKRERLAASKRAPEKLEATYKLAARIEAEEIALETATMVVASTAQEIEDQYQKYDHYVPDRMEVIPPGVDLSAFHPPGNGEDLTSANEMLAPFLRDPSRPMILTMARPDERKNLEKLVQVYGESEQLQSLANLVVVMGARDDLRTIAKAQRTVLQNVITLIDVHNLYGKVAYPKSHEPSDVPNLYRLVAASKGVFINPALTEPFGLTLLEAAASGLPIVATNDGGPRDIIANCKNGLLIDPLDGESIEKALLRMLTEPQQWKDWSDAGIEGVHQHYTWGRHAKRYLRDIKDIVEHSATPALVESRSARRLPDFDRLVITDLDNTLTGDEAGLAKFSQLIRENSHIGFGITTGRDLKSALKLLDKLGLPKPDVMDTSCGTELHYGEKLTSDRSWRKQIAHQWKPAEIQGLLDAQPGFFRQADGEQSEFKISYKLDPELAPKPAAIKRIIREAGLRAKVVVSLGIYLDVIPVRGGSGLSLRHLIYKWGFAPEQLLVAGDSGNDEGMLKGRSLGVVVANYSPELEKLRKLPRIYFAQSAHAEGIIEGINYYKFLDHIVIPNDSIE